MSIIPPRDFHIRRYRRMMFWGMVLFLAGGIALGRYAHAGGLNGGSSGGNFADGSSGTFQLDALGQLLVSSSSLPLPTGAATSANQVSEIALLTSIDAYLASLDGKTANDYGASSGAIRTASQIGNASGAADFGSGATTAQTQRVTFPTNQLDVFGAVKTSNFLLNLALQVEPGYVYEVINGKNRDIDTANAEDICDQGGTYPFPTVAAVMQLSSTSVNDTALGTGARTVLVTGLNSAYAQISESVVMNGLTNVPTVNSYLRIHSIIMLTSGASETNEGTINLKNGASIVAQAAPEAGRSFMAVYTVPAGKTALVTQVDASINPSFGATGSKELELQVWFREFGDTFRPERSLQLNTQGTSSVAVNPTAYIALPEKLDFKLRGKANQNNTTVNTTLELILRDN